MTEITYPNEFGETQEQARARWRCQKAIVNYLRSDLYERVDDEDPASGMTWESPLKWKVRISAPGPRVQVTDPRGEPFADYVADDGYEIASLLP